MLEQQTATLQLSSESPTLIVCQGAWVVANLTNLEKQGTNFNFPSSCTLDASKIDKLDIAGALLLQRLLVNNKASIRGLNTEHQALLNLVQQNPIDKTILQKVTSSGIVATIGEKTVIAINEGLAFISFIGEVFVTFCKMFRYIGKIPFRPALAVLTSSGYQALPIIGLLSFLIGIVLAYQMGLQLKTYGANIFIVNLLGLSLLREFAPLIAAIIVAGRTGSAFAAELGTMKVNEEIDALRTMGVTPTESLVLPRILALVIALPLLTVWADMFGILGGMFMAKGMLNISYLTFLQQFPQVIGIEDYSIGVGKAPVFALIITTIGCFQGLRVTGGADSVGKNTTKSVVHAIFFIIVADAAFSILFSWLGI